ncbi:MAG: DUF1488 family protein [Proteobacteria bacterium]|nr:DUF1488 family protein [Pseudomonadota bacterium]
MSFPGLHCWNPVTEVITIAAEVGGNRVSCRIDFADIKSKFKEVSEEPLIIVKTYRKEIESAARKLIENNNYEKDGSILISFNDLSD